MLKQKGSTLFEVLYILVIILIIIGPGIVAGILAVSGYQNTTDAIAAAEASGFKNPKVVNTHRWISASINGCGGDWKATKMTAVNPSGKDVVITICEGMWFKGATIRH